MESNQVSERERLRQEARETKEETKQVVKDAARQVKDEAKRARRHAKERSRRMLEEGRERASRGLGDLGAAFRSAADTLEERGKERTGHLADYVAEQAEDASRYLGDRDVKGILREAREFARRQPAVVLGGLFLVGVGVARFLKASEEEDESEAAPPGERPSRGMHPPAAGPSMPPPPMGTAPEEER